LVQITDIAQILSITPLFNLVNLLILFPWYSKLISLKVIAAISSGCWLLPAAFFPMVAYLAARIASSGSRGSLNGLWYFGHVGGMTWWT